MTRPVRVAIDGRESPVAFDKEYFSRFYGDYERQNPPKKSQAYLRMIRRYVPGGRLLDIGCSYGLFVREAAAFFACTGMDVDRDVVATAAARVPDATFVTGTLPCICSSGLDVVTALDVIEHVPDPEAALASISAALRQGGIALVVVPAYDGPLGWLTRLLDRDPTHLHKRSRKYWIELAGRHLEVLEWQGFLRKLLFRRWYLHVPMRTLRSIAPAVGLLLRRREAPEGGKQQ
jgi:2-polyprenyl-3-methyl-5-hydroxy-6-metoxy-1,4-benzoquinol methylase